MTQIQVQHLNQIYTIWVASNRAVEIFVETSGTDHPATPIEWDDLDFLVQSAIEAKLNDEDYKFSF